MNSNNKNISVLSRLNIYFSITIFVIFLILGGILIWFSYDNYKSELKKSETNINYSISTMAKNDVIYGNYISFRKNIKNIFKNNHLDFILFTNSSNYIVASYPDENLVGVKLGELVDVHKLKYNNLVENVVKFNTDEIIGTAYYSQRFVGLGTLLRNRMGYLGVLLLFLLILVLLFNYIITAKLLNPLKSFITSLGGALKSGNELSLGNVWRNVTGSRYAKMHSELSILQSSFNSMISDINKYRYLSEKNARFAAIGQASSHLAHDMRSPISVLQEFVNDMDEKSKVSHNSEFKTAVKNSINKLDQMANELNDYSKATQIKKGDVVLNDLVKETVIPEIKFSSKHNVRVKHNVPDDLCVHIDEDKMARVIINIANNAVQAIDHEEGEININVEAGDSKAIKMTISDNGKGIAEKHLPHVFDGFYTFGKRNGTGLGLSYCKQVVGAHGGEISVISELGKGTTFEIELPDSIVEDNETRVAKTAEQTKEMQGSIKSFSDINFEEQNVLLVDDDSNMRFAYKRHIIDKGGVIVFDADKPEDVTHASEFDFNTIDIAIVDYEFKNSEKNGIDIVGFLKEKDISSIYLCTGHFADANIVESAMNAGASAVLNKSIG